MTSKLLLKQPMILPYFIQLQSISSLFCKIILFLKNELEYIAIHFQNCLRHADHIKYYFIWVLSKDKIAEFNMREGKGGGWGRDSNSFKMLMEG